MVNDTLTVAISEFPDVLFCVGALVGRGEEVSVGVSGVGVSVNARVSLGSGLLVKVSVNVGVLVGVWVGAGSLVGV